VNLHFDDLEEIFKKHVKIDKDILFSKSNN